MARYQPWMLFELEVSERITGQLAEFPDLMYDTLWQLGDFIRDKASMYAPFKTGTLREAISVTTRQRTDHAARVARGQALRPEAAFAGVTRPPEIAVDIHAAAGYATFQEYGTRRNPAHPFLFRAGFDAKDRFAPLFARTFLKRLYGITVRTYKI